MKVTSRRIFITQLLTDGCPYSWGS